MNAHEFGDEVTAICLSWTEATIDIIYPALRGLSPHDAACKEVHAACCAEVSSILSRYILDPSTGDDILIVEKLRSHPASMRVPRYAKRWMATVHRCQTALRTFNSTTTTR